MQAAYITAVLQKAAQAPALAGIYIKSVCICAVRDLTCDPVLTITWSMPDRGAVVDSAALSLPGVSASFTTRPSDTAMLLPRGLVSPAEIEDAVIGAAWSLGAWDLCRIESAPLADGSDWREARYGIKSSFGHSDYVVNGQSLVVGDGAPQSDCEIAARDGYITWRFVPLALATLVARRRWADKDKTLLADCTRSGAPGGYRGQWMHPTVPGTASEQQYQLGRSNHGNRSKKSADRRATE
jgi:hypothetical protein